MPLSPHGAPAQSAPTGWLHTLHAFLEPPSLRMLSLGFSAGLPLLLVFGTLSFWLREAGIERSTIGFLSWVGLVYGFKWLWSPLVDRLPIPWLTRRMGRRRSWLLLAQAIVVAGLLCMAACDPRAALAPMVYSALTVALGSATQDIALDAFRIESASAERQGVLAASYQTGYRLAMIWAGAGTLWVAAQVQGTASAYQHAAWQFAYVLMALSMLPGTLTVLFSHEPVHVALAPGLGPVQWLRSAVVEPFAEFIARYRWQALLIVALIASYRISDVVMGIMANPFYVDMGYSKVEVAKVSKLYGVLMTLSGAFLGGALTLRLGVMRVLALGAVMSACSHVLFAWLATQEHDVLKLVGVISADNLASGVASSAFIAYLSSLTNVRYSATQYAMFSSMMLLLPKLLAGGSGVAVDQVGYAAFFLSTAFLALPVVLLVALAARVRPRFT